MGPFRGPPSGGFRVSRHYLDDGVEGYMPKQRYSTEQIITTSIAVVLFTALTIQLFFWLTLS